MSPRRRRVLVVAAALAATAELAWQTGAVPVGWIGPAPLYPSLPFALAAAALADRWRWPPATTTAVVVAAAGAAVWVLAGPGRASWAAGVALASANEELVYRACVPLLVGRLVPGRVGRRLGAAVSCVWFALLPGHRAQMRPPLWAAPWLGVAWLLWRVADAGCLPLGAAAHAGTNLWSMAAPALPRPATALSLAALWSAAAAGFLALPRARARPRACARPRPTGTVPSGDG